MRRYYIMNSIISASESGTLTPYLPIVIPFVIIELILLIAAFVHLLTHKKYKYGTRLLWIVILLLGANLIGPIFYFIPGRSGDE